MQSLSQIYLGAASFNQIHGGLKGGASVIQRRLATTKTLLGISVQSPNCSPACTQPPGVAQIRDDLFDDANNVATVLKNCSYNQYLIEPVGSINGVTLNGAYEVSITENANGDWWEDVWGFADTLLESDLGASWRASVDVVVYFLPEEITMPITGSGNMAGGMGGGGNMWMRTGHSQTCAHVSSVNCFNNVKSLALLSN